MSVQHIPDLNRYWRRLRGATPEKAAEIVYEASGVLTISFEKPNVVVFPAVHLFGKTRHKNKLFDYHKFVAKWTTLGVILD